MGRQKGDFVFVPWDEIRSRTGVEPELLLMRARIERVTRIFTDGRREDVLRVPAELVAADESPVDEPA